MLLPCLGNQLQVRAQRFFRVDNTKSFLQPQCEMKLEMELKQNLWELAFGLIKGDLPWFRVDPKVIPPKRREKFDTEPTKLIGNFVKIQHLSGTTEDVLLCFPSEHGNLGIFVARAEKGVP